MELDNTTVKKNKTKQKIKDISKNILIIILIVIIILLLLKSCQGNNNPTVIETQQTAVLSENGTKVENNTKESGDVRIVVNTELLVEHQTIQNLYLTNKNEDCKMEITIKDNDNGVLYKSPKIEPGEVIIGDVIDITKLKKEKTNTIGEIRFYDQNDQIVTQTNVEMLIILGKDQSIPNK